MTRHLLPKDLTSALAGLSDTDLDQLLEAVLRESAQRGQKEFRPISGKVEQVRGESAVPKKPSHRARNDLGSTSVSLNPTRINGIRAAFAAGVKLTVIARQFGVSLSTLKSILSEVKNRKA